MLIMPSFQKSLTVEQFPWNYLNSLGLLVFIPWIVIYRMDNAIHLDLAAVWIHFQCFFFSISNSLWKNLALYLVFIIVVIHSRGLQTINNYWTRLSKISWFFIGEQINYLPKPNVFYRGLKSVFRPDKTRAAEANNWSARHWKITIFCDNQGQ